MKLFVQLNLPNKVYKDQVSISNCVYVADFKELIRQKFIKYLASYEGYELKLYQPDGSTEIDPQTTISRLDKTPASAFVVMVDEAALKFEKSIKKQTSKRAFTAGSSFKNFLDALAHKLAILYSFPWNDPLFPTIADVLHAKEHSAWTYNNHYISIEKSMEDCRLDSESKGIPIADISLPEIMDEEQWVKLKELIIVSVQKTPNHIIPRTTNGKCTIVIPTSVFNDKTITFFKKVGVAVLLFAHEDDVVVIDEGELISSTNHESHSKRKRKKESSVISS